MDPACPGQGGLKEPSNGFLRRYGLPKQMDFAKSDQTCEAGQKGFKIIKTHPIRYSKTLIGCLMMERVTGFSSQMSFVQPRMQGLCRLLVSIYYTSTD